MIAVSSADRVVYPDAGITKGDVVAHYAAVAEAMLPHVEGRPLTLFRHPKGLASRGFFQKQSKKHYPAYIPRIDMPKRGGVIEHPSVTNADGLCYLANQNTLEFHTILRRLPDLRTPDRLVIDLDPPIDAVARVRRAARHTRTLLDELGAASVPVASGGKGYHVYVTLTDADGRSVATITHILASVLAHLHPEDCTVAFLKKDRDGRVLVDWMRNGFGATVIAPWSLRARPGAPVAVPIGWSELDDVAPSGVSLRTVGARLDTDPLLELPPTSVPELLAKCLALKEDLGVELVHVDRFGRVR